MDIKPLKIGISACLLGERVRYDGGHKRNQMLLDYLALRYALVPICPEVAAGLGVPRPPVQLVARGVEIRAVGVLDEQLDVTRPLIEYGRQVIAGEGLCGFVFKSRSPRREDIEGRWDSERFYFQKRFRKLFRTRLRSRDRA
jgi:uncharacterized protein YbbK (DUF523 family)